MPLVKDNRDAGTCPARDCDAAEDLIRSCDEYPLIFGRATGREGGDAEKSGGIVGSARSLRSVIFTRSPSALFFKRIAHCRRG